MLTSYMNLAIILDCTNYYYFHIMHFSHYIVFSECTLIL